MSEVSPFAQADHAAAPNEAIPARSGPQGSNDRPASSNRIPGRWHDRRFQTFYPCVRTLEGWLSRIKCRILRPSKVAGEVALPLEEKHALKEYSEVCLEKESGYLYRRCRAEVQLVQARQ